MRAKQHFASDVMPLPRQTSGGGGGGGISSQSGYAASASPVDLGTDFGSVLPAPISATLIAGAQECVLTGTLNVIATGSPDSTPEVTVRLLIDGGAVFTDSFPAYTGLPYAFVFRATEIVGTHTFDLQAEVNSVNGGPAGIGGLTLVVTP
jgi:hypothetical protein